FPLLAELVHLDLELRLKAGEPVRVETYLERFPELARGPDAVVRLIATEFDLRRRREPDLTPDAYLERFPAYREDLRQRLSALATLPPLPPGATPPPGPAPFPQEPTTGSLPPAAGAGPPAVMGY